MTRPIRRLRTPGELCAENVLNTQWSNFDISPTPIDPVMIARNLGINVYSQELPADVSGYIIKHSPGHTPDIFVNREHAPVRQRFTVAHELGHYFKRREMGSPLNDGYVLKRARLAQCGVDDEEIYANQFAAALLMPEDVLIDLKSLGFSNLEIKSRLEVSLESLELRLQNLGMH